ncbi:hypothetical protein CGCSCA4_v009151 [Colletotrichum siamense]|uniref:Uncharacterized protein n=1 Tax=Colletotrichum siamense TaxID=690259 RepID=A0A9P5BPD0_COLSI|nr:hypothetical protein CGCSCA4_v009151 [Colletotrichum siamense]KAF4847203.1 hypothetical protein CGCSCA2_v012782 [Colletotrichum siamense]
MFAEITSGCIDLYNLWGSCSTGMLWKMIDRIDKRLHDVFDTLQSTTHITGKSYEYPADAPQLSRPAVTAAESSNTTAEQSTTRTPTPSEKKSANNQDRRRGKGKNNKKRRNDSRAPPYPTPAKQYRGTKQGNRALRCARSCPNRRDLQRMSSERLRKSQRHPLAIKVNLVQQTAGLYNIPKRRSSKKTPSLTIYHS